MNLKILGDQLVRIKDKVLEMAQTPEGVHTIGKTAAEGAALLAGAAFIASWPFVAKVLAIKAIVVFVSAEAYALYLMAKEEQANPAV